MPNINLSFGRFCAYVMLIAGFIAAICPAQPQLSDQTIERPLVGLTATIPMGATVDSLQIAGRGVHSIKLPGIAALINVSDRRLAEPKTLDAVADAIIDENLASVSPLRVDGDRSEQRIETAKGRVITRQVVEIDGWPAQLIFLELDARGGTQGRGYGLLMPTATSVAMFELQGVKSEVERAWPYFKLLFESARIADFTTGEAERALGVERAVSFIGTLEPEDYERVLADLGEDWRYERFYKPGPTGSDDDSTELGYRRTRYAVGTRGELKARREQALSPSDRERGYLVFQEARLIHDRQIVDVAAGFFMTPDRSQETWTIRQTIRPIVGSARAATTTVIETGTRDRADLLVTRNSGGASGNSINPAIEGPGYVSRLEVYLMPHLLRHKGVFDPIRAYAFNPTLERVTLREDALTPRDEGGFDYTSSPSEGSPGQTVIFGAKGNPLRADLPGDQTWEPVDLQRLFRLWEAKGLPLN